MSNKSSLVELGRTKIEAFPLGFGGIPIQRVSEEEAVKVVKEAVNNGINLIDTARAYGDSEEKIGKALSELDEKVHIATKTLVSEKEDAIEKVEKSLEKLRADKIDIYQLHAVNDDEDLEKRMREGGALEGLKQKQEEDEIEHIGISGHRNETLVKALETGEFDTVMFCYNFIENECEEDLIEFADDRNVGMLGMKPLAGGRLDAPEVALKYVLRQKGVLPIPGMETKEEVQENIKIANALPQYCVIIFRAGSI